VAGTLDTGQSTEIKRSVSAARRRYFKRPHTAMQLSLLGLVYVLILCSMLAMFVCFKLENSFSAFDSTDLSYTVFTACFCFVNLFVRDPIVIVSGVEFSATELCVV